MACGFRLAGTAALPKSLAVIQLVTQNFSDSQRVSLMEKLERAGTAVVTDENIEAPRLFVNLRKVRDLTLANSASNGDTVKRITRQLEYRVQTSSGRVLVETTTLTRQGDITLSNDNLHSSNQERRDVVADLEQGLVNQLLHRLERL